MISYVVAIFFFNVKTKIFLLPSKMQTRRREQRIRTPNGPLDFCKLSYFFHSFLNCWVLQEKMGCRFFFFNSEELFWKKEQ